MQQAQVDRQHRAACACSTEIADRPVSVDRLKAGRSLTVFVSVELDKQNDALLRNFEKRMSAEPDVMAGYCSKFETRIPLAEPGD